MRTTKLLAGILLNEHRGMPGIYKNYRVLEYSRMFYESTPGTNAAQILDSVAVNFAEFFMRSGSPGYT